MTRILAFLFIAFAVACAFVGHYRESDTAFWWWSVIGFAAAITSCILAIIGNGGHTGFGFVKPLLVGFLQLANLWAATRAGGVNEALGMLGTIITALAAVTAYVISVAGHEDQRQEQRVEAARKWQDAHRTAARRRRRGF